MYPLSVDTSDVCGTFASCSVVGLIVLWGMIDDAFPCVTNNISVGYYTNRINVGSWKQLSNHMKVLYANKKKNADETNCC